MMPLHPSYVCNCAVPVPKTVPSPTTFQPEDSGLCEACNGVYDENLYEMMIRQYQPGYDYATLHDFLKEVDPNYAALS